MSAVRVFGRFAVPAARVGGARRYLPTRQLRSIATYVHANHATALSQIQSKVETSSSDFQANAQDMDAVVARMREIHAKIEAGGGEKARQKHLDRGKMLARE